MGLSGHLRRCVRMYTTHCPVQKGKYFVVHSLRSFLGSGTLLERVGSGYMMELDLNDYIQRYIYFFGYYETAVTSYVKASLHNGMVFADIGANVGQYTLLAAQAVGPKGFVFAVEPEARNFARLQRNVELNGFHNVDARRLAVSESCGKAELYVAVVGRDRTNSGEHSLRPRPVWSRSDVTAVDTVTLDRIFEGASRLDMIKIDVEGAELMVLRGACETLRRLRPQIVIEAEERNVQAFGYSTRELKQMLAFHGYDLYRIENRGLAGFNLSRTTIDEVEHCSMLAATVRRL
jgi:FkbM family methyltransferase